jgi:hypothetical protein
MFGNSRFSYSFSCFQFKSLEIVGSLFRSLVSSSNPWKHSVHIFVPFSSSCAYCCYSMINLRRESGHLCPCGIAIRDSNWDKLASFPKYQVFSTVLVVAGLLS